MLREASRAARWRSPPCPNITPPVAAELAPHYPWVSPLSSPRFESTMTTLRSIRHGLALALAASILAQPRLAAAQAADPAAADKLFNEGRELLAAHDYAAACPKFEESQRLDPGSGTLINLAECYAGDGRLAAAWRTFLEAAAAAQASGNTERETVARRRAEELAPRVPKLQLSVRSSDPALQLTLDRTGLTRESWGAPLPLDPGMHELRASAPQRASWTHTFNVRADGAVTEVTVPELAAEPIKPVTPPPSPHAGLPAQRIAALAVGGVGVAGVIVGTVFGLRSMSKHNESERHCPDIHDCNAAGIDAMQAAYRAGNVSTVAFIVGGVGLAGGAVLWFTSKPEKAQTQVGLGLGSVRLSTAW